MEPGCDLVEKLLQSTGLSCEDLLLKLQQYRSVKTKPSEENASSDSVKESDRVEEKRISNDNSVILEAQSSTIGCSNIDKTEPELKASCNNENESFVEAINQDLSKNSDSKIKEESCPENYEEINNLEESQPTGGQILEDTNESFTEVDTQKVNQTCNGHTKTSDEILKNMEEFLKKDEKHAAESMLEVVKDNEEVSQNERTLEICDNVIVSNDGPCTKRSAEKNDDKEMHNSIFFEEKEQKEEKISTAEEVKELTTHENEKQNFEKISTDKPIDQNPEEIVSEKRQNTAAVEKQVPIINEKTMDSSEEKLKSVECAAVLEQKLELRGENEKQIKNFGNEHNYSQVAGPSWRSNSNTEESPKPSTSHASEKPLSTDEENLRNILRLQLSSLRSMKKSSGNLTNLKKPSMFFHNLKKKRKSCDLNVATSGENSREKEDDEECEKKVEIVDETSSNDNSLVSLSEGSEFVIMNVVGGVDLISSEETKKKKGKGVFASVTEDGSLQESLNMASTSTDSNSYREKRPNLVVKNMSESFKQDSGCNKSVKNSEKSPFVSDSLEDFLNESAQLRISYAIPKLGAEEGITENTKKCPFDNVVSRTPKVEHEVTQKDKPKLVKAKTLAEMRRHMEKLKQSENQTLEPLKAKYKRRKKETVPAADEISSDKTDNINSFRNNFLTVNDKKIWVLSKPKDKCIGILHAGSNKEVQEKITRLPRKPSLLSSLSRPKPCPVKYKPGPLSKKASLQNTESRNIWTTEVKNLPKINLEVTPEIHKLIHPSLVHLLPIFDDMIISEERTDFALSVLKPKNTNIEPKSFNFHIPFKNKQEKMVVRKRCEPEVSVKKADDIKNDPETDVKGVIEGLLTYVEIKEIEDSLIKEDDFIAEKNIESSSKTKTKKIKRKKLDLELRRLNCKVIDVGTSENEHKNCQKPYCQLGCVCKSLLCESVFSNHCRLLDCMFECKCPETSSETNLSNNSLSVQTVSHLEDKAKKNLAKVEKEFTQTLIHTDNDAILVGTAKVRRSTKPPKKYTDFIDNDVDFDLPVEERPSKLKVCNVVVHKMDLGNIVPFCLVHNLHDCHCKGEDVTFPARNTEQIPKIRIVKIQDDLNKSWYESCARIRKVFPEYKERNKSSYYNDRLRKHLGVKRKYEKTKKQSPEKSETNVEIMPEPPPKPNKRKQSFTIRDDGLLKFPSFEDNSKSEALPIQKEFALQRRKKKIKSNIPPPETSTYRPVFNGEIKVYLKDNQDILNVIGPEHSSLEYLRIIPWKRLIESFHKGKMCIWSKESKVSALLCNSSGHLPPKSFIDIRKVKERSDIINWILTDTLPANCPRNLMHLVLTPKNENYLIAGYCLKTLTEKRNLNDGEEEVPFKIARTEPLEKNQKSVLINQMLVANQLELSFGEKSTKSKPERSQEERFRLPVGTTLEAVPQEEPSPVPAKNKSIKIISTKKYVNWMSDKIPTLHSVLKNQKTLVDDETNSKKTVASENEGKEMEIEKEIEKDPLEIVNIEEATVTPNKININKPKAPNQLSTIPTRTLKCTHRDMNQINKTLILTNRTFIRRKLQSSGENLKKVEVVVPLPLVSKTSKWRMIHLNSDFTYLMFVRPKYSIKYTDLMDVVKMSKNVKSTISLRNKEFTSFYKHPLFGIFCVPNYQDRLFVGPFLPNEDHNLETLRYLQGKLIDTQIFNKMIGKKASEKDPVWMYETVDRPQIPSGLVIDITEDEDDRDVTVVEVECDESPKFEEHLLCPPFVEELTGDKLPPKSSINRYFMTNIPYLGYFTACQRDNQAIEMFWPTGNKAYRFSNVTLAKNILTHYLTQLFCPIPQEFKITVIIMTNFGGQGNKPIDPKYFTQKGTYFCGDFGTFEKSEVPEYLLSEYDLPSADHALQAHKEFLQNDDDSMIRLFGLFLMSNEELRIHSEPHKILQWAKSEIYILQKLSENYTSEKADLQNIIRKKSRESKETENTDKEVSETIEIKDSDEEDKDKEAPVFQKISLSGRIPAKNVYKSNERSLLKPNVWAKSGRSLLKTSPTEKKASTESPPTPVKISINNSNFVLNRNKILVTKIK